MKVAKTNTAHENGDGLTMITQAFDLFNLFEDASFINKGIFFVGSFAHNARFEFCKFHSWKDGHMDG